MLISLPYHLQPINHQPHLPQLPRILPPFINPLRIRLLNPALHLLIPHHLHRSESHRQLKRLEETPCSHTILYYFLIALQPEQHRYTQIHRLRKQPLPFLHIEQFHSQVEGVLEHFELDEVLDACEVSVSPHEFPEDLHEFGGGGQFVLFQPSDVLEND